MYNNGGKGRPCTTIEAMAVVPTLFATDIPRLPLSIHHFKPRLGKASIRSSRYRTLLRAVFCRHRDSGGHIFYLFGRHWPVQIVKCQAPYSSTRKGGQQ